MDIPHAWSVLRLLRSQPPGKADNTPQRRRTFSAALEQAEELWRAAAQIPPAASPIVLFYAMTQAAVALCAARVEDVSWEARPRHGLNLLNPDLRDGRLPSLKEIQISEQGQGFVHQVAGLLGSPVLTHRENLAALLRSLPEFADFLLGGSYLDLPQPLTVYDGTLIRQATSGPSTEVEAKVGPLPPHLHRSEVTDGGSTRMVSPSVDEILEWFAKYPTLASTGRPRVVGDVQPMRITRDPDYLVRCAGSYRSRSRGATATPGSAPSWTSSTLTSRASPLKGRYCLPLQVTPPLSIG